MRRQEERPCTSVLDHAADPLSLVTGEIVQDDQIAVTRFGNEDLFDTGLEGVAVDREDQEKALSTCPQASVNPQRSTQNESRSR